MIVRRRQPNELEFNFLKARVLENNIGMHICFNPKNYLLTHFTCFQAIMFQQELKPKKQNIHQIYLQMILFPKLNLIQNLVKLKRYCKSKNKLHLIVWSPTTLDNSGKLYFDLIKLYMFLQFSIFVFQVVKVLKVTTVNLINTTVIKIQITTLALVLQLIVGLYKLTVFIISYFKQINMPYNYCFYSYKS